MLVNHIRLTPVSYISKACRVSSFIPMHPTVMFYNRHVSIATITERFTNVQTWDPRIYSLGSHLSHGISLQFININIRLNNLIIILHLHCQIHMKCELHCDVIHYTLETTSFWRTLYILHSPSMYILHSSSLYILHSSSLYILHSSFLYILHSSSMYILHSSSMYILHSSSLNILVAMVYQLNQLYLYRLCYIICLLIRFCLQSSHKNLCIIEFHVCALYRSTD